MRSKTIVLVHGNFVSRHSWAPWVARYEARGYTVVPVAYPGRDRPVPELKAAIDEPVLRTLDIAQVIDHHVRIIQSLPEKPILIGHSFGGLITQNLIARGHGVAAVAISSVPPPGVLPLAWSLFRATWPIVNPFIPSSRPYYMPFSDFQYAFANDLGLEEQRAVYDAVIVPESRRLSRSGLTSQARVHFRHDRPPLLMIGAELDHIMPATVNRANFRKYAKSPARTDWKEFPGRAHYSVIGGKGWEEVADYALEWAEQAQPAGEPVPV